MKKLILFITVVLAVNAVFAAGFGIYEASPRGNALGGTLVGSTRDASAVYYNPANMTEMTNVSVMVGVSFINPFCDTKVDGIGQPKMNPGWFVDPTFYATIPLPADFALGIGGFSEFGLGTKYGTNWMLAGDTIETTIKQYTLNPVLAYKVTDWWSIAGGLKMSYITFNNKKHPLNGFPGLPRHAFSSELDGHDYAIGYNFATDFKILDNLSFGLHYRSMLKHDIKGDFTMKGPTIPGLMAPPYHLPAAARLDLPQSITGGINWDATEKLHLGFVATWTQWSSVDNIKFRIPQFGYNEPLHWKDAWRFGWGAEYDLTDDFAVRLGYVHDRDPSGKHGTTMLPPGDRHIIGTGFGWYVWRTLRLDVGYNFIIMQDSERDITLKANGAVYGKHHFECRNSFSHIASVGLSYTF